LLLQIRGAVAEYERTLIADRMRRGRQQKFRAGTLLPWSRPPYGYRLNPDRPRDPTGVRLEEAEAACVAEMFALYLLEGQSLAGIVKYVMQLGIPNPSGKSRWSLMTIRGDFDQPGLHRNRVCRTRACGSQTQTSLPLTTAWASQQFAGDPL
jgi:site-specific DNA recombinase